MTGSDAEILCGEWQTGDTPQSVSGEQYNIRLDIKKIVRHPDYFVQLNTSSFLQFDVAVFKVYETFLQEVSCSNNSNIYHFALSVVINLASLVDQEVTNQERLYPACLPTKTRTSNEGFHSGWSKPMPSDFLSKNAPRFLKVEEEFRKQQVDHKICFEKPPILNMSLCVLSTKSICSNTEWKLWISMRPLDPYCHESSWL